MNLPSTIMDYCKKCRRHTEHKLKAFKAAPARKMSWGTRQHERKHKRGYGGKAEFTITVKKQTKKPIFVATCSVCNAKHYFRINKRMKKAELKAKE